MWSKEELKSNPMTKINDIERRNRESECISRGGHHWICVDINAKGKDYICSRCGNRLPAISYASSLDEWLSYINSTAST